jgi:hypothetical protein
MELANEIKIFTKIIANHPQALGQPKFILQLSPKLQRSIDAQWQATIVANPDSHNPQDIAKLLVADLFDRLEQDSVDRIFIDHWLAFLFELALLVSAKIFKTINRDRYLNIALQDIQSICLGQVVDPQRFFANFNLNLTQTNDLLSSLKAYAYQAIKYAAYPSIRNQFLCPNIGRSNLSLFNQYSDQTIAQALGDIEGDRRAIERDLLLCHCARAYLRQRVTRINLLQPDDFHKIGELYQGITGDLPPPVSERLEQIGSTIRQFTSPRIGSLDLPIGENSEYLRTIGDRAISLAPQPEQALEIDQTERDWQNILDICDRWLVENTQSRDRQIIYLRYHFRLKQKEIEPIIGIEQTNISRRLRQIHLGIARSLTATINPDPDLVLVTLIKPIVETLQASFDRLIVFHTKYINNRVDIATMNESIDLIQKHQRLPIERTNPTAISRIGAILEQLCN